MAIGTMGLHDDAKSEVIWQVDPATGDIIRTFEIPKDPAEQRELVPKESDIDWTTAKWGVVSYKVTRVPVLTCT